MYRLDLRCIYCFDLIVEHWFGMELGAREDNRLAFHSTQTTFSERIDQILIGVHSFYKWEEIELYKGCVFSSSSRAKRADRWSRWDLSPCQLPLPTTSSTLPIMAMQIPPSSSPRPDAETAARVSSSKAHARLLDRRLREWRDQSSSSTGRSMKERTDASRGVVVGELISLSMIGRMD